MFGVTGSLGAFPCAVEVVYSIDGCALPNPSVVISSVQMQGSDVIDQPVFGGGGQSGFEQDGVVPVGATDGPTDRYALSVAQ